MSTLTTLVARTRPGRRHPTPGVPGARSGISSVITMDDGCALTASARLCFLLEERYENHVMPGSVVDVLRSWGHHVDVLRLTRRAARAAVARAATTLTFAPVQEATA